jgi:hypothetical protein
MGLRLRIGPNAFGNALGQSLAENMKPASGNLLAIIRQQENAENSLPMNRTALGYEQRDVPLAERLGILSPDSAPEMSLARNLDLASGSAPVGDSSLDPSIQQVFVPHAKWTFEQNQAYDDALRLPDSAPGQWMNDFDRGRGGEYRSAVEGPAPSGERFGRNVGAAAEFGKGMVGWHNAAQARDDWKKGNYGTAVVNGAAALGMAGSTILSAGTLGAARQAGITSLSDTLAVNEAKSLRSLGASSATAELSPGALLREKYGYLSTQERQAIISDRLEIIASDRLASLEQSIPGAHFQGRHGAQTTLAQQYDRAVNGIDPITGQARYRANGTLATPDSSRFMSARDQINAIERATNIFESTGSKVLAERPIVFRAQAGEGYYGGTGVYDTSYSAQVWFNKVGQPITAFPKLGR